MLKKQENIKDLVFSNLTDLDIFNFYFGEVVSLGKAYPSKFRKDLQPSTGFYISKTGKIIYNDLTTGEKLDCINFIMKLYDIGYHEALKTIINDFDLKNTGDKKIITYEPIEKKEVKISIIPKDFTEEDLRYWSKYNISQYELKKNNVYSVDTAIINDRFFKGRDKELKYAYILNNEDKTYVKLYAPKATKYKWISNIPLNKPHGLNELPHKSKTLIITKSLKDKMVLNKFYTDVISLQNESLASMPSDGMDSILNSYSNIYVNFDNDKPGKTASLLFEETYGFKRLMIPNEYNVKDFSDYVNSYGINHLNKLLKWINIKN